MGSSAIKGEMTVFCFTFMFFFTLAHFITVNACILLYFCTIFSHFTSVFSFTFLTMVFYLIFPRCCVHSRNVSYIAWLLLSFIEYLDLSLTSCFVAVNIGSNIIARL